MEEKSKMEENSTYGMIFKDFPDIVSVEQMSQMLGISTKTGYKLLRENKIAHLRFGRKYAVPKLHILKYMGAIQCA